MARAFVGTMFLCFFFGFNSTVEGQYSTRFLTVDPYSDNSCIGSTSAPEVHQIYDTIGVAGIIPRPVLATFTGGRKVGGYFFPCMGMTGYATSSKGYNNDPTTMMPNKLTVNFHKPVYFGRIDIDGKYPQRVKVSLDGGNSIEVELNDEYPIGDGKGHIAVFANDFPGITSSRFSTINVESVTSDWRFGIYSIDYFDPTLIGTAPSPPNYCNVATAPRPAPQNLSAHDWTMRSEVSDVDGLVLSDVRLKGRLMAERISVPYYKIETNSTPPMTGELRPNDSGGSLRSRLVSYETAVNDETLVVKAVYAIDVSASQSCLSITQRYEFRSSEPGSVCAPGPKSGHLWNNCSRWRALVTYDFKGNSGEVLKSLNVAQRSHFRVNDKAKNSVGLFRDCDFDPIFQGGCLSSLEGLIFKSKLNPLYSEHYSVVVANSQQTGSWDNIHQTSRPFVSEPINPVTAASNLTSGGCPECMHSHWRWGRHAGQPFNDGNPYVPLDSNQDLSFGVVRYRAGEEHPSNFLDLINASPERIRSTGTFRQGFLGEAYRDGTIPEETVYWLSATGRRPSDRLFSHYSFFNTNEPNIAKPIERDSLFFRSENSLAKETLLTVNDAPTSIIFGDLYEDGTIIYRERDPDLIASLPNAYAHYNNISYDVRTEAQASGSHTITFDLPSVTNQATFDSLRILHSEPDPFNSENAIWVDRTILSPNSPAPNFASRTISAKVNEVGPFVIVRLVNPPPINTNVADLSVSISESADPVAAGSNLIYTVNVTNNSSVMGTGVIFSNGLSPDVSFVSADAGAARFCREEDGTVVCDLSSIAAGVTIPVIITVKPNEGTTRFPPEGKSIVNTAFVSANESDPNDENNTATVSTNALRQPIGPPTVKIQTPTNETILRGPVDLEVAIKAFNHVNDSYAQITGVELFQNGQSVGSCPSISPGYSDCSIAVNNVSLGEHSLVAMATNDVGRKAVSAPVNFYVNGPATVALSSPTENLVFGRPANIVLTAIAANQSGSISQVEFTANGVPIGNGTLGGTNQYTRTWNNAATGVYSVRAIATDGNGVKSYSYPMKIYVTDAPTVNVTSPATGTTFAKPVTIALTADAKDFDGYVSKVEFFSNGTNLIGEGTLTEGNTYNFAWLTDLVGNHTVTAVATDNTGKASTSSPINLTITNVSPTVSISNPINGTVYNAPANIPLSADASDSDGRVTKIEFFNGSTLLSTVNDPPYDFSWNNVVAGNYNLTAKATDDNGASTTSAPISITVNSRGDALFVVGDTTLSSVDNAIKTRLQNLGLNVIVKLATSAVTADATGKKLVVISDSVSPTNVNTKFRAVAVPVVTLDPQLFDDMGMCATATTNFGTTASQKNVTITNASHPMAAGLSGTVQVTSGNTTFGWGIVNANAAKIATLTTDATKATSFGYASGTAMPGLTAPARRVGFFYTASSSGLTINGGLLFDNAVKWAAGL